ncbi:LysE family translocator [Cupriavidus sp. 30B13]|uniref:LysE family translocator n=1 Tax=Cupriavidus sp. 30B13 TaxID=3384241 RepID=UPI003B9012E7
MLGITDFPLFVGAVFLLNVTPGPDTAYIVGRSVAQGRAAGVVSALGVSAGCCVHSVAIAFGLTALLAASATAFTVIKFAGAAYLAWLGLRLILQRRTPAGTQAAAPARPAARGLRALFMQGFLTNVLNPKVILFFVSFFPQFVDPHAGHQAAAFLVLGGVMVLMSTLWNGLVAWMAGTLTRKVGQAPRLKCWLDRFVGIAFIGLGARLALVQR